MLTKNELKIKKMMLDIVYEKSKAAIGVNNVFEAIDAFNNLKKTDSHIVISGCQIISMILDLNINLVGTDDLIRIVMRGMLR